MSKRILIFTASIFLMIMIPLPIVSAQEDVIPAQEVVDHYISLFNQDWNIGESYDPQIDGLGYAQSYDRYGSPSFTPHIRPSLNVTDDMTITPIESPTNSEDAIMELINSANDSLLIEQMYIYETLDEILSSIINAYNRGVNVCVIQGHGISEDHNNASADILETKGIEVRRLKSNSSIGIPFDIQHNKGIIVDGKVVLVSSINWSPTSLRDNRECGLIIESAPIGAYYTDLFNYDWEGSEAYESSSVSFSPSNPMPNPSLDTFSGEMDVSALACPDNCFGVVNGILSSAQESIWISTYTLSSPYLVETIRDRIADGVDVKLLLEKNQVSSSERAYNRWSMMNMTVLGVDMGDYNLTADGRWASSSFDFQHCKYAVVDGKTLIISSGNWGRSSCPKPQDDDDVDGNRDWWFVVYGDGNSSSLDLPWWAIVVGIFTGIVAVIGGIIKQRNKK